MRAAQNFPTWSLLDRHDPDGRENTVVLWEVDAEKLDLIQQRLIVGTSHYEDRLRFEIAGIIASLMLRDEWEQDLDDD